MDHGPFRPPSTSLPVVQGARRSRRRALARASVVAAALVGAWACGDPGSGPDRLPASLVIEGPADPLFVGHTASLTATVLDREGRTARGAAVSWTSRDSTTVAVDAGGLVLAVRSGEAWVVAEAEGVSDSLFLDVRHELQPGEGRLRVTGDVSFEVSWTARSAGLFRNSASLVDLLGREEDYSFVSFDNRFSTDTIFVLLHPGSFRDGVLDLQDWHPSLLIDGPGAHTQPPVAYLILEDPVARRDVLMVALPPARVELTFESRPPGPGLRAGVLGGRLVAEGRLYDVVANGQTLTFAPREGSHTMYVDFRPPYYHWAVGISSGAVQEGPEPTRWTNRATWWNRRDGGDGFILSVEEAGPQVVAHTPLAAPGAIALGDEYREGGLMPQATVTIHGTPSWTARSVEGTLDITSYTPTPAADLFGAVVGTIHSRVQGTRSGVGDGGFTAEVEVDFHAPVWPQGFQASPPFGVSAVPGAFTGGRSRSPLLPPLLRPR